MSYFSLHKHRPIYYQRQKCRCITLVSGNVRKVPYMWIFARFFSEVTSKDNDSEVVDDENYG